jgi:hypothetical protein
MVTMKIWLCASVAWSCMALSSHAFASRMWGVHQQSQRRFSAVSSQVDAESTGKERVVSQSGIVADVSPSAMELVMINTRTAIENAGSSRALKALAELRRLCSERQAYNFEDREINMEGSAVVPLRQVLPPNVTEGFLRQVHFMEENGWMSTNPDSVDGLPSLHLNLISQGKPLFHPDDKEVDNFQRGIQGLVSLVQPHIYHELLPSVQKIMNSSDIVVSDVFLRRYGQDISSGATRHGISAHYDVYAKVTAVIALDNVAAEGKNGLYTTDTRAGETSNHASLRRFFPLHSGDGVVHTWDILHGVDVQPGLDRTSLVVWFSTKETLRTSAPELNDTSVSPWLSNHPCVSSNGVVQFVLASAMESAVRDVDGIDTVHATSMYQEQPKETLHCSHYHQLYLRSAAKMNAFALTRVGTLCQEKMLSSELIKEAEVITRTFRIPPATARPLLRDARSIHERLARQFWLEGALRGNPLAQIALGDEAMELSVVSNDANLRLLAATLFSLAAQQGVDSATDAVSRVVEYEAALSESAEEFLASDVLGVAHAAV